MVHRHTIKLLFISFALASCAVSTHAGLFSNLLVGVSKIKTNQHGTLFVGPHAPSLGNRKNANKPVINETNLFWQLKNHKSPLPQTKPDNDPPKKKELKPVDVSNIHEPCDATDVVPQINTVDAAKLNQNGNTNNVHSKKNVHWDLDTIFVEREIPETKGLFRDADGISGWIQQKLNAVITVGNNQITEVETRLYKDESDFTPTPRELLDVESFQQTVRPHIQAIEKEKHLWKVLKVSDLESIKQKFQNDIELCNSLQENTSYAIDRITADTTENQQFMEQVEKRYAGDLEKVGVPVENAYDILGFDKAQRDSILSAQILEKVQELDSNTNPNEQNRKQARQAGVFLRNPLGKELYDALLTAKSGNTAPLLKLRVNQTDAENLGINFMAISQSMMAVKQTYEKFTKMAETEIKSRS